VEKARQWGMRCVHEAKMWKRNAYITLTYNDVALPPGGTLVLRDVQLFMKRLRKSREPDTIRFFLGGEYGETNGRPHYHALLFNCGFPDMLFHTANKRGEPLYTSKELDALWQLGYASIGEVTFDSAVYCAKYALKKVTGDKAVDHYTVYDENGECFERLPEFAVMSRRPGIGRGYYERFGNEVRAHDSVVIDGREVRPPKYYDDRSKAVDVEGFERHKRRRKRLAVLNKFDNTAERLAVKEKLLLIAADKKERKL
jgi:hypothetical protein